jgi:hypothetical protein
MYKATIDRGIHDEYLIIETLSLVDAVDMLKNYFLENGEDPTRVAVKSIEMLEDTFIVKKQTPLFERIAERLVDGIK